MTMLLGTRRALLGGQKLKPFDFDPALTVFTPGMAKRTGTVFAAAPIVQGNFTSLVSSDTISVSRGSQIHGSFYANHDGYQGSIVLWYTPEDALVSNQWLFEFQTGNGCTALYVPGSNLLQFYVGGQAFSVAFNPTAGTTYQLGFRWNYNNHLDGTNYACITVNNVHTFGITTSAVKGPFATFDIANAWNAIRPASGIIEGFTVYRRPLFDGAYGVDVGNGDEINLIYAAGAGSDPCLITGSWDVVFCLPTNSATGALLSGVGEAWSHPHSSALLEHTWLEDGGYLGGPYGVLYNATTTSAVVTDGVAIQDLQDNAFTAEAWIRADSYGEGNFARIFDKGSRWIVRVYSTRGIDVLIDCATTNANSRSGLDEFTADGKWHHIAVFFDDAGDRKIYIAIDGVWVSSYDAQTAGVGAITSDVGQDLYIGNNATNSFTFDGVFGWSRISNNDRYSHGTDFVPARTPPATDGNTVVLYHADEGTGNTWDNETGAAAYDATLSNHVWEEQWDVEGSPVVPYSVEFNGTTTDIDCGSAAALDNLPAADFTWESWVRWDGESDSQYLAIKLSGTGWYARLTLGININIHLGFAVTNITRTFPHGLVAGTWNHLAVTYDTGDSKARIWVNGVLLTTSAASAGAYSGDAAGNFYIGSNEIGSASLDGAIGWTRLSNSLRYTADFIPPSRLNPPGADGNTVEQWDFRDGKGTTLTALVTTPGNDGTITAGEWNITPDMAVDAPGQRVFNWGYCLGVDAANEGVTQIETGLAAGADRVLRLPLQYERDRQAWPRIQVYDETNGAAIVNFYGPRLVDLHTGANNLATLINSNGHFPQSLVGATLYNITDGSSTTITAVSGDMTTITGVLAGGTENDWDTNDVYMIVPPNEDSWVWCEPFCYELPTISRNGVAADCVSVSTKVMNANTEGLVYMHQVEAQANLVDNPSLETGAGNPWIPDGWLNYSLEAGDSQASSAGGGIIHSGSDCIEIAAVATQNEGVRADPTTVVGNYYGIGTWAYGNSTQARCSIGLARGLMQFSTSEFIIGNQAATNWVLLQGVARALNIALRGIVSISSLADAAARYFDDAFIVALDAVALTVTPASLVNSEETSGLRVDGIDTLTQVVS